MTDLRQAAQQALEALETCGEDEWHSEDDFGMVQTYDEDKVAKAITALRTALEQQQAEPVAVERWLWIFEDRHGDRYTHKNLFYTADEAAESARICGVKAIKKIDSSKVMQQAEPVAWRAWFDADHGARWLFSLWPEENRLDVQWQPLYTTPPQRQWVGLTDEDCKRMSAGDKLVAMWAEAKLKERNT